MNKQPEFSFKDTGESAAYDDVLAPLFFEPWAEALIQRVAHGADVSAVDEFARRDPIVAPSARSTTTYRR